MDSATHTIRKQNEVAPFLKITPTFLISSFLCICNSLQRPFHHLQDCFFCPLHNLVNHLGGLSLVCTMPGASIQSGNAVPIAQKIVIHIEKDNGVFIPLVVDIPHTITSIEQFMSLQMVAKDVYRQQVSKLVRLGRLLNLEHPSIRIAVITPSCSHYLSSR